MVDNIITKPLGLVLIVAAHMALNAPVPVEVTGILGTNITLQFTFWENVTLTKNSQFGIYIVGGTKIDQYTKDKEGDVFHVYPKNNSVFWHKTNLKLNDSKIYWASLFKDSGPPSESYKVQLIVQEENRSSTVPPMESNIPVTEDSGSSSHLVTVLVVSPVVLLAAALPGLILCLVRTKDKDQQRPPQQISNPTVQETADASKNVAAPSVIYSVLDFPKRPPAVVEINPSDTEYAAVSYLPEKRRL